MTLPNFLVIGAMRSGTTWLDQQLRSHSSIYMPEKRKEVHFFNDYYDRGLDWYKSFFPSDEQVNNYKVIGETTPGYMYVPEVPERIQKHIPDCKFIAILRNPVDRAYSQYKRQILTKAYKGSFEEYLNTNSGVFLRGLYGKQLERYLEYFSLENILVLIFESTLHNPKISMTRIANFLSIDPNAFGEINTKEKVNDAYRPRFPRSYALARTCGSFLREHNFDWAVNFAKSIKLPQFFGKSDSLPKMEQNIREQLLLRYEEDICHLEQLLGIDISLWRK